MNEEIIDNNPQNPFEAAIDRATGYDPSEAVEETAAPETDETPEEAAPVDDGALFSGKMNAYEKAVAKYLEKNASEPLREKILAARKEGVGISQCFAYITAEAKKQAKNGCAMIEDEVVYGWAVHYFEDGWIAERERKAKEEKEAEERKIRWEQERKERAEKNKAEAERRKAEAAKTEEQRLAEMSEEDRAAYLEAKAERERVEAEKKAAEDAKREEQKRIKKELHELSKLVYKSVKEGHAVLDNPEWNADQVKVVKEARRKAKADLAAEKKAAKERAEAAQMMLF